MKTKLKLFTLATLLIFSFSACEKDPDEPVIPNEEEIITTVTYTLTPVGGGTAVVMQFKDLDGDGGNAPVITADSLDSNTTYNGILTLLNETESPAGDITAEIKEEDKEHQFFFTTTASGTAITYEDMDGDGNPIGLTSKLVTGTSSGALTIVLRHEPSKTATGVSSGDITNAGGETDIEVTFPVNIK